MFDWVPLHNYSAIFFNAMLFISVIVVFLGLTSDISSMKSVSTTTTLGYFILILFLLYMGLRPISEQYFGDMGTYNRIFKAMALGEDVEIKKDYIFNYFMKFCSSIMSANMFFLTCAIIYTVPCYIFAKKFAKKYWFYIFFMLIGSFSFWPYGTNGIRNGLATSVFILGLCFYDKKIIMFGLFALALGLHNSIVIPVAAYAVSAQYKNPKIYLSIWLFCIPLSLIGGGFWESFFGNLGFNDDRAGSYLTKGNVNNDSFSYTGFRWDFVLYSATAVFAGYYFIFKKNITDKFYIHLFGIYTIANAFWILVIRANFSNRFAYLSWFLMAIIISYPMFKYKIWKDHFRTAAVIFGLYYLFTYFLSFKIA